MDGNDERNHISERFNKINWHDSKLIEVYITYAPDLHRNDVHLKLRLLTNANAGSYEWTDATLRIQDCTIIRMNLDLTAKLTCSDDIAIAFCEKETSLKERIQREDLKYEVNPLADYLHFHVSLIAPAGGLDIFAKNFELED